MHDHDDLLRPFRRVKQTSDTKALCAVFVLLAAGAVCGSIWTLLILVAGGWL